MTIYLLVSLCSFVSVMVLGSSSLKTSSSGIALLCFLFGDILYIYFQIIDTNLQQLQSGVATGFDFIISDHWKFGVINNSVFHLV